MAWSPIVQFTDQTNAVNPRKLPSSSPQGPPPCENPQGTSSMAWGTVLARSYPPAVPFLGVRLVGELGPTPQVTRIEPGTRPRRLTESPQPHLVNLSGFLHPGCQGRKPRSGPDVGGTLYTLDAGSYPAYLDGVGGTATEWAKFPFGGRAEVTDRGHGSGYQKSSHWIQPPSAIADPPKLSQSTPVSGSLIENTPLLLTMAVTPTVTRFQPIPPWLARSGIKRHFKNTLCSCRGGE